MHHFATALFAGIVATVVVYAAALKEATATCKEKEDQLARTRNFRRVASR
jgi:hypothetical protein